MSSIRYRPEIDGLRALAILPVIAFHFGAKWIPGGFVGVDVFFVISGYLITCLILKEHSQNAFTLRNFWLRRVRRIMPAMLFMLFVTLVAAYFVLFSGSWRSLGWQSISTLMLSANVLLWHLTHNYWGPAAEMLPLLHNWSLSVEEQFYLVYPLFLVASLKWFPKKMLACLAGILALSLTLSIIGTLRFPSAAFFLLPTRAWELAGGCFLAGLAHKKDRQPDVPHEHVRSAASLDNWLAVFGIVLIGASWFVTDERNFPGYMALMPVVGSMLVIQFAGGKKCPATFLLVSSPLRFVGMLSYSLYLWHWPVIVLGRAAQARWEDFPTWAYIALIPALAVVSYYLVESPGRRRLNILPPVFAGVCVVAAISSCLIIFKPSYDLSKFAPTVWQGNAYSVAPSTIFNEFIRERMEGIDVLDRDPQYADAYSQRGIIKRYGGERMDVFVLGNSHALMWAPVIDRICRELGLTVSFYAADAVPAFPEVPARRKAVSTQFSPEQWFLFDSNRIKLIKELQPRLVIVASRWSRTPLDDDANRFLEEVSRQGSSVLFIADPPELAIGEINAPKFVFATSATTVKAHNLRGLQDSTVMLRSLSDRFQCVHVAETSDLYLVNGDRVKVRDGNAILYINDDHLSLVGALLAKERIRTEMSKILRGLSGSRAIGDAGATGDALDLVSH